MTSPKNGPTKPLTPEQQIKALQVQLREASEKAQLFEAIVDVLKEDHGVHIVKKAFRQALTQRRLEGLSVAGACRHFGISRQAYCQGGHRQKRQLVESARAIALVGGLSSASATHRHPQAPRPDQASTAGIGDRDGAGPPV